MTALITPTTLVVVTGTTTDDKWDTVFSQIIATLQSESTGTITVNVKIAGIVWLAETDAKLQQLRASAQQMNLEVEMTSLAPEVVRPDPSTWYRAEGWNFAHRLDATGGNTLCRRTVIARQDGLPVAMESDERCPVCGSILGGGGL